MIFNLTDVGDLPNGTIVSLGTYYPVRYDQHKEEWTQLTLKLKSNDDDAVDLFVGMLGQIIRRDVAIAVVPSSTAGTTDVHGITRVAKVLAGTRHDATGCIVRHTTIKKLSHGGNRSQKVHEGSLRLENGGVVSGREALLIDDVVTSGNSVAVCTDLLLQAGAARVNCLTISRTHSDYYFLSPVERKFREYAGEALRVQQPRPTIQIQTTSPYFSSSVQSTPFSFQSPSPKVGLQLGPTLNNNSSLATSFRAPKSIRERKYILFDFDLTLVDTSKKPFQQFKFSEEKLLEFRPYTGVIRMLRRLAKAGRVLAIVTSSPSIFCIPVLEAWNIYKPFSVVVGYHETKKHKPDPEPVQLALNRLGASPDDAVFVGDSATDIQAGSAAGTMTVGVRWGKKDNLLGADHLVDDVPQLLQLLAGLTLNRANDEVGSTSFSVQQPSSPGGFLLGSTPTFQPPPFQQLSTPSFTTQTFTPIQITPPVQISPHVQFPPVPTIVPFDRSRYRSSVTIRTAIYLCANGHGTYIGERGTPRLTTGCSQCSLMAHLSSVDEFAV